MDREQLQNLHGIFSESARILKSYHRLFLSLASTLILPLCFMLLAHSLVSAPLVHKIRSNERFIETHDGASDDVERREEALEGEWASLLLFFAGYLLFVLAFSLLSTAAIVYSVACIYTEKSISYTKVLGVVPKVWKRLLVTFLWVFLIIATYHFISILSIHMAIRSLGNSGAVVIVVIALAMAFIVLHVYINCIWHLASVITVLEESYGIAALRRSFELIKGKRALAFALFFAYLISDIIIGVLFHVYVLHNGHRRGEEDGNIHGTGFRIFLGTLLVCLLTLVTLFGMLAQTVFYFSCKAFHNEHIDMMALSEHLGAYMGEYVPLKSSIQMEPL